MQRERGDHDGNDLAAILTTLKTKCGAGGTIQNDAIEIQGKHSERIGTELRTIGYRGKGG